MHTTSDLLPQLNDPLQLLHRHMHAKIPNSGCHAKDGWLFPMAPWWAVVQAKL